MAETYRVLGQLATPATTLSDLYTVPALTKTIVSSIVICNRGGSATKFRVSVAVAGAVDATNQYIYYDQSIPATDTFVATIGITLATTDIVRVYAISANVTFSIFGTEVT